MPFSSTLKVGQAICPQSRNQADEKVAFFQSDMTSAFYLFRIPPCWHPMMTFNIGFIGPQLGISSSGIFRPCRSVIPMGWSSAVSLMQEIAERLTTLAKLPSGHRVRRTAPIPAWLVDTCEVAVATEQPWYHVYFCAMQRWEMANLLPPWLRCIQSLNKLGSRLGYCRHSKEKGV